MALPTSTSILSERLADLLPRYYHARERAEIAGLAGESRHDAESDRFIRLEDKVTSLAYREGIDLGFRPDPNSPVCNIPLRAVADGQNLFIVFGHDPDHEGGVSPEELLVIPLGPIAALVDAFRDQSAPGKTRKRRKSIRPGKPILQSS